LSKKGVKNGGRSIEKRALLNFIMAAQGSDFCLRFF